VADGIGVADGREVAVAGCGVAVMIWIWAWGDGPMDTPGTCTTPKATVPKKAATIHPNRIIPIMKPKANHCHPALCGLRPNVP
jgi:hypothetical protein